MTLKGLILPGGCAEPSNGVRAAGRMETAPGHAERPAGRPAWTKGALQRVANRPVIGHVLQELRAAGVREAVVALPTGPAADDGGESGDGATGERLGARSAGDELRTWVEAERPAGLELSYVPWTTEDPGGALAQAAEAVGEAACVAHAADGLLAQPVAPLAALLGGDSPDLVTLVHRPPAGAASIGLATRRLLRLAGSREEGPVEVAGVFLLGRGALREAGTVRWCGERGLDLISLAERLAEAGGAIRVQRVRGWRQAGSSTAELLELNRMALDALCPPEAQATEGNRIEGNVELHPTACVQSSTIVGPAIVGAGALVLDSYIGPYTSIGAGARVEGAEVERSIVLEGASITHIGGRLVASVVGREARIYRDFSLPRALRVTVGDGDEVALC